MRNYFVKFALIILLTACSNTPDFETGEIKTLQLLKTAFSQTSKSKIFINSKDILSRKQIDDANTAVLFVELETGQNGTLTPYPGQGDGQTWLGADGATITLERGILKASRGMGTDLMGSSSTFPLWRNISSAGTNYYRELSYIDGNNKIDSLTYNCKIKKNATQENLEIWGLVFLVTKYEEDCHHSGKTMKLVYYLDTKEIVRKSLQHHSREIGYLITERLDRL